MSLKKMVRKVAKAPLKKVVKLPVKAVKKVAHVPLKTMKAGGGLIVVPSAATKTFTSVAMKTPAPVTSITPAVSSTPVSTTTQSSGSSTGFTDSGYDPNAVARAYGDISPAPAPSGGLVSVPAQTPAPVPESGFTPSGYDPNAIMTAPVTPETVDPSMMSDPIMKQRLEHVRKTNPDYYAFIVDYMRRNPGVNSTLQGMGEVAAPASSGFNLSELINTLGTQYTNYQMQKQQQKQQSEAQTKAMIEAMKQSNQHLLGGSNLTMLIGAAVMLGLALFIWKRK